MQAFLRAAGVRSGARVFAASVAVFTGIQIAGYGTESAALDLACALILVGMAGVFHFQFMDGIARLDKQSRLPAVDQGQGKVAVAITGTCAFLFSALSMVMPVRLLAR
jgi:hypothetical protein